MAHRIKSILALAASAVLLLPDPAAAKDIVINAAEFTESHNEGLSSLSGVPGFLTGMDYPGDWTEYHFTSSEYGRHRTSISLMGTLGVDFHVELLLTADGIVEEQLFHFYFTGKGFG